MHRQPWYQLYCYSVTFNFLLLKETPIDNTTNLLFCFNEAQQVHSVWLLLDRIYCKKLLLRKIYNSSIEVFHAIPKITFRSWGTANIVLGCTKKGHIPHCISVYFWVVPKRTHTKVIPH